jgi:hypothetical protein
MSVSFNAQGGLILVQAEIEGPNGRAPVTLALDTGARRTLLREAILLMVGYDPALVSLRTPIVTASGAHSVPQLPVIRLSSLGHDRLAFPVLAHNLPLSIPVQGLLGLDFYRGLTLKIDFRTGLIDLT